jgi:hypothetical protein
MIVDEADADRLTQKCRIWTKRSWGRVLSAGCRRSEQRWDKQQSGRRQDVATSAKKAKSNEATAGSILDPCSPVPWCALCLPEDGSARLIVPS